MIWLRDIRQMLHYIRKLGQPFNFVVFGMNGFAVGCYEISIRTVVANDDEIGWIK